MIMHGERSSTRAKSFAGQVEFDGEILAYLFYDVLCNVATPEPQKTDVAFNVSRVANTHKI